MALAGRLLADGVEVVVMESTSDYWRIWYYLLEPAGLNVQLVNSRHARLEAIAGGERDPKVLAARVHGNIKGGAAATGQSLEACSSASTTRP
jgi:transposase